MPKTSSSGKASLVIAAVTVIATALFFSGAPAHAFLEKFFKKNAAPQKTEELKYVINDDASFDENKKTFHMRPYNNPALEFDISIPKTWTSQELTNKDTPIVKDTDLITDVAQFKSEMIGTSRVSVSVSFKTLDKEIYAKDWLKNYILTNGYALQDDVQEKGGKYAQAYYTSVTDFTNYYTMISAQINSNYIILCRFDLPLNMKDYLSFAQKKIVESLQITNTKTDFIEIQKGYTIVDALKFNYPITWQPDSPDFKNMSRLSIGFLNHTQKKVGFRIIDTTEGYMNFLTVRRSGDTNLKKELLNLKTHFSDMMGLDVTKLVLSQKPEILSNRFIFARYEVYETEYKKGGPKSPEIRLVTLGDKDWYVFIYMVTPSAIDSFPTWAHNVKCFDIIIKSIR